MYLEKLRHIWNSISNVDSPSCGWYRVLPQNEQAAWLDAHRERLEDEFCNVGSWTFGDTKSYGNIVQDLAGKLKIRVRPDAKTQEIEQEIVAKVWNDAVSKLTAAQLAELKAKAEALAHQHGTSIGKEAGGLAVLSAAQLSGFGVYLLGSTILGAVNGALGLGLGFGAFTGLSSAISTVIGPIGWAALGVFTVAKLGAPNYKKILPVVILIAAQRAILEQEKQSSKVPLLRRMWNKLRG